MKIERTEENAQKLALLLRTIQTGELDGVVIRPSIQVDTMASILSVSRNTLRKWRDFDKRTFVMPVPANLRAIAKNLLGVREVDLERYFQGTLTLRQLLEVRAESYSPEEIYHFYQTLQASDKDALLAVLLRDRAKDLGNGGMKTKRNPVSSQTVIEDTEVASSLGEGLSPKAAKRLQNLLNVSRAKHSRLAGENLDFYEILERAGMDSRPFVETIDAAAAGQISEIYGPRLFREDWNAIAVICFQPSGWKYNQPEGLYDQTSGDHVDLLKRSLMENGEPRPSGRR